MIGALTNPAAAIDSLEPFVAARPAISKAEFPQRAAWLRQKMGRRTPSAIERLGGPHKNTVKRALDGHPVNETVLDKFARVLRVDVTEIPDS
jgi:hypothetical protein